MHEKKMGEWEHGGGWLTQWLTQRETEGNMNDKREANVGENDTSMRPKTKQFSDMKYEQGVISKTGTKFTEDNADFKIILVLQK